MITINKDKATSKHTTIDGSLSMMIDGWPCFDILSPSLRLTNHYYLCLMIGLSDSFGGVCLCLRSTVCLSKMVGRIYSNVPIFPRLSCERAIYLYNELGLWSCVKRHRLVHSCRSIRKGSQPLERAIICKLWIEIR